MIKVGSDFSGVGAFNQALIKLGKLYKEVFACDMDKYARQTFIENYGEPEYFPTNVYNREIPIESLDIYMTSPPCQAFSLAGKRLGKEDKRGILFFNSHEFIQVNKPRFFIFENVKGLLSDNGGKTFSEWVAILGGKSVNGNAILFPYEDSVPYHLYWQVLNAKEHGVPQNRERVFLIGIRDDQDNKFQFPKEEHLVKRLKDVLENDVADKYFLSEKMINHLQNYKRSQEFINENTNNVNCITSNYAKQSSDLQYLKIKSATSIGFEIATKDDSINFSALNSKTRRGRVGKGVAQTLNTACQQGVMIKESNNKYRFHKNDKRKSGIQGMDIVKPCGISDTVTTLHPGNTIDNLKIRRLTPRECFRLMDFPDSFIWTCSDSQAYKQAGNSIVVNVIYKILKQLPL